MVSVQVLSEWCRQESSHSSTDATDVRAARLKSSRAEPGAAKQGKIELTGAQMNVSIDRSRGRHGSRGRMECRCENLSYKCVG